MGSEEKLDRVLSIIVRLADVMETTLQEVKASNRSRWIILFSMLAMAALFTGMAWVGLNRMSNIADRMEETQAGMAMESARFNELIKLIRAHTKSKKMKEKLMRLQLHQPPTPENVIRALATYNPKLIIEEADRLKNGVDSETDSGTDGGETPTRSK